MHAPAAHCAAGGSAAQSRTSSPESCRLLFRAPARAQLVSSLLAGEAVGSLRSSGLADPDP